jgi:hypothetical protein
MKVECQRVTSSGQVSTKQFFFHEFVTFLKHKEINKGSLKWVRYMQSCDLTTINISNRSFI